jgi:Helicase conserved C-terminal domain/SNF2-related domain
VNTEAAIPRVGMFATVRNRRGVISAVEPFDGEKGRLHLVHLEYKDDQYPVEERLLWELEPRKMLLEPTALPDASGTDAMPADDFDALLRATRWTAATPYLDPDDDGPVDRLPVSSPFHGAVQVEDYQLVPLLKALRMPRVNLLIADDVGLGKTIEAGLILSELLLRRRIQRVLILTPASLRLQWRDEMWDKFSLSFDLVDRAETNNLRKRLGMDANPWRSFSRIITSYHYLRQEDVREQFLAACRTPEGSPHLPWDLLIVDECHNLMPSSFGEDSDLCRMLRIVAPQFEHRLFLSATPHNGHTRCFTGLLEILDPVRFSQTDEIKLAEKERIQQVVLRRLKREINARTNPPRFCTRLPPRPLLLSLSSQESALSSAFGEFRSEVKKLIAGGERRRKRSGSFAVEILGKRLLSCPTAFAESWRRCKEGLAQAEAAADAEVAAAERLIRQETGDDREAQSREATAAGVVGSWLKAVSDDLRDEIGAIDRAVMALGFDLEREGVVEQNPKADARFDSLVSLIDDLLRSNGQWRDDERLIVFTEYKTTLDYLVRRLRNRYEDDRILTLFGSGGKGGMDEVDRDLVKNAFNDPAHSVRILVATDAAAEGLNLQGTARYLLHFDCPWNPSRLEQRNGRLDRHGQARDVTIHHFISEQDQDLSFLAHVLRKADEIREDLGSANELFDEAAHRKLVDGESLASVQNDLDRRLKAARGRAAIEADDTIGTDREGLEDLQAIASEIDLDPAALRDTLEAGMAIHAGRPQLDCSEHEKICRILNPGLPGWSEVIDDSLRQRKGKDSRGPVVRMAFSPDPFLKQVGQRLVFTPRPDVQLMHLSHPMIQKALGSLTRRRFPGTGESVSRWTVRLGNVPANADALVLLSVEELAVNELRESFHHWVRTIAFPVQGGNLLEALKHRPPTALRNAQPANRNGHLQRAQELFEEIEPELKAHLRKHAEGLTSNLKSQLELDGVQARKQEDERYRSRQGEVSALIAENTLAKLGREVEKLKSEREQGLLFDEADRLEQIDRSIEEKKEEIARRTRHYEEVRIQLDRERERILKHLLPRRYALSSEAQVFPVCIEIRFPGGAS